MTTETIYPEANPLADALPPDEAHAAPMDGEAWSEGVDHEGVNATRKDSQLPGGSYNTVPSLSLSRKKYDDGRRVANFFGQIIGVESKNEGVEGRIRFAISPDRRDKLEEEGKPDLKSRLYAQAVTTYERVMGVPAATIEDVLQFVANNPVRLRLMQGDEDNVVLNIGAIRE